MKYYFIFLICLISCGCTSKNELGTEKNPIRFALVPGQDSVVLMQNSLVLQKWIFKQTGLHVRMQVPTSYIAVVEGFGSQRVDVAILNTFGYLLAHDKYQAEAYLIGVNGQRAEYWGQIIAKNPRIEKVKDLQGKKFAFVDPASASGYLLAAKILKDEKVKLGESVFAGKHDNVVSMVYQGRVDAGATYHTPAENGEPQDARRLVHAQYPDVYNKVRVIAMTGPIPSDPVIFRKGLDPELRRKVIAALKSFGQSPEGPETLKNLYMLTGFKDCTDQTYDPIRKMLLELSQNVQDLVH